MGAPHRLEHDLALLVGELVAPAQNGDLLGGDGHRRPVLGRFAADKSCSLDTPWMSAVRRSEPQRAKLVASVRQHTRRWGTRTGETMHRGRGLRRTRRGSPHGETRRVLYSGVLESQGHRANYTPNAQRGGHLQRLHGRYMTVTVVRRWPPASHVLRAR